MIPQAISSSRSARSIPGDIADSGMKHMKTRGLSLDGPKRRKAIIVAVALAVMAFAGPAGATPPKAAPADVDSVAWTSPGWAPSGDQLKGRSWS